MKSLFKRKAPVEVKLSPPQLMVAPHVAPPEVVLRMPTTEGEETATVRRDVEKLTVSRIRMCIGQSHDNSSLDLRQGQTSR